MEEILKELESIRSKVEQIESVTNRIKKILDFREMVAQCTYEMSHEEPEEE